MLDELSIQFHILIDIMRHFAISRESRCADDDTRQESFARDYHADASAGLLVAGRMPVLSRTVPLSDISYCFSRGRNDADTQVLFLMIRAYGEATLLPPVII